MARRKPQGTTQPSGVREILNENARAIVTIPADHPGWFDPAWVIEKEVPKGALVRLFPPADVSSGEIENYIAILTPRAQAVRLMPAAPRGAVVVGKQDVEVTCPGAREVITKMAEEVPSADRDALRKLCERVMVEVKL